MTRSGRPRRVGDGRESDPDGPFAQPADASGGHDAPPDGDERWPPVVRTTGIVSFCLMFWIWVLRRFLV